jgi:hypothetical protein
VTAVYAGGDGTELAGAHPALVDALLELTLELLEPTVELLELPVVAPELLPLLDPEPLPLASPVGPSLPPSFGPGSVLLMLEEHARHSARTASHGRAPGRGGVATWEKLRPGSRLLKNRTARA